jgi:hypothetical protein
MFPKESTIGALAIRKINPMDIRLEDGRWVEDEQGKHWLSYKPIRLVFDQFSPFLKIDPLPMSKCKEAWTIYCYVRAQNAARGPAWKPAMKTLFDKVRFELHLRLIRWGVII